MLKDIIKNLPGLLTHFAKSVRADMRGERFFKNPKAEPLADGEQLALNLGAILATANGSFCNSLATDTAPSLVKTVKNTIERDWGIMSGKTALERLEGLKNKGHRKTCNLALRAAPECFSDEFSFSDYLDACRGAGYSPVEHYFAPENAGELHEFILEKHGPLAEKAEMAPLAERGMKAIGETNFELGLAIDEYKGNLPDYRRRDLLGKCREKIGADEKEFDLCLDVFSLVFADFQEFLEKAGNLKRLLPMMIGLNYFGMTEADFSPGILKNVDMSAWDYGRMVNVARWSCTCGYVSEAAAWEYIFHARERSAALYRSYAEFARSYLVGRLLWFGPGYEDTFGEPDYMMGVADKLLSDASSPWHKCEWKVAAHFLGDGRKEGAIAGRLEALHIGGLAAGAGAGGIEDAARFIELSGEYVALHGGNAWLKGVAERAMVGLAAKHCERLAAAAASIATVKWEDAMQSDADARRYCGLCGDEADLRLSVAKILLNLSTRKEAQDAPYRNRIIESLKALAEEMHERLPDKEIADRWHAFAIFNLCFAKENPEAEKAESLMRPIAERRAGDETIAYLYEEILNHLGKGKNAAMQGKAAAKWRHFKVSTLFEEDAEFAKNRLCRYCESELPVSNKCGVCGRGKVCGYCGGKLGFLGNCKGCGKYDEQLCFYCGAGIRNDSELRDYVCKACGRVRKY